MKLYILIALLIGMHLAGLAQTKSIIESEQLWLAYLNQTRFTKRSGLWFDTHFRFTDDFANRLGLTIFRPGYTFYISDQARFTAGYAYVTLYSGLDDSPAVPEHRPW